MALVGSAATQPSSLGVEVPNRPRRAVGSAPRDWVATAQRRSLSSQETPSQRDTDRRRAGACVDSRTEKRIEADSAYVMRRLQETDDLRRMVALIQQELDRRNR